jgi:hypothetical protein
MIKEASLTGKTGLNHFWSYGKNFFLRMFLVNIVLSLIQAVHLIFGIRTFYGLYNSGISIYEFLNFIFRDPMSSPQPEVIQLIFILLVPIAIGLILTTIYAIIVYVLFFFVGYNIVVDDLSAIGGFKKSISLLKEKTSQVLMFIVVLFVITLIFTFIIAFISVGVGMIAALFGIILSLTFADLIIQLLSLIISLIFGLIIATFTAVWITRFYMAITEKPLYVEEKLTNY